MKRISLVLAGATALLLAAASGWAEPIRQIAVRKPAVVQMQKALQIGQFRQAERAKLINQKITIEGQYYDGSDFPMIIDNIERVFVDLPLPADSYVPIVGPKPQGLKWGDRISISGTLAKPTAADHLSVQSQRTVLRVAGANLIQVLQPATRIFQVRPLVRFKPKFPPAAALFQKKYAVLIAGGADFANNHLRYWNDLKTMYSILLAKGYPAANIYVVYANGVAKDPSMPVNYSATSTNINTVFTLLAGKLTMTDTLYIMLNDHGGGYLNPGIPGISMGYHGAVNDTNGDEEVDASPRVDEVLCLWNENMTDDAFAAAVNRVTKYDHMIIQMKQCFGGGFIKDLTGPRRTVMASSRKHQVSWSHPSGQFGSFTFWYFAALTGSMPDGTPGTVNADTNGDGKVSILEAYNFARSNSTAPENTVFEDDGVVPGHEGPMPAGGDGIRSANIFL